MDRIRSYLSRHDLERRFDALCSGHDMARSKPAPDIYLHGAAILGLRPEECLALEDSPAGIESAFRAGCIPVMIPDQDQPDAESMLRHYFPDVVFSAIQGHVEGVPLKPDPAGALLIAQGWGVNPADCLYVGDTSTDMNCGGAAGMETVGVLWGYRPREELTANGARHLISDPMELVDLAEA